MTLFWTFLRSASLLSMLSLPFAVYFCILLAVVYVSCIVVYNNYFHPLRHYQGPWLACTTTAYRSYYQFCGIMPLQTRMLHEMYGPVVRIAPDALSYSVGSAWRDIYGYRSDTKLKDADGYFKKDLSEEIEPVNGEESILWSSRENHRRIRGVLSQSFQSKNLRLQEDIMQRHTNEFMSGIAYEASENAGCVSNMIRWFQAVLIDTIGELCIGRSFGLLEEASNSTPWIDETSVAVKSLYQFVALRKLVPVWLGELSGKRLARMYAPLIGDGEVMSATLVADRAKRDPDRADFMTPMLKRSATSKSMSAGEITNTLALLLSAGIETTSTALSGATYLLCSNSSTYAFLTKEIRSTFSDPSEITMAAVSELPYLQAVLAETLRLYPPVPTALPRVVPHGGATIVGQYVPGGTSVAVAQLAANYAEYNFTKPKEFMPERWLDDEGKSALDDKFACQPFSYGPKDCLGRHLAMAMFKLCLSKILLQFDVKLAEDEKSWMSGQKAYFGWEKPPLAVLLTKRGH